MVQAVSSVVVALSLFISSVGWASSLKDQAQDIIVGTGVVSAFVVLPGIMASVGAAGVGLACGQTALTLSRAQWPQFLDHLTFDADKAAQSFRITCVRNQNQQSVFIASMVGKDISQKMLYSRLNRYQKCEQFEKDLKNQIITAEEVVAEEGVDSLDSQEYIARHVFQGRNTECTPITAALAQQRLQEKIKQHQVQVRDFFPLFFRNHLATDPNVFLPEGSPLLKPISVEEFLDLENQRRESERQHKETNDRIKSR